MEIYNTLPWYENLVKIFFAQPVFVTGTLWIIFYCIVLASFLFVFYKVFIGKYQNSIAVPFLCNIFFNVAYAPLQFYYKDYFFSTVDISLVFITIIWAIIAVWPKSKIISLIQLPYFFWVTYALVAHFTTISVFIK
jgi:tryptophan-rich sensory protein